MNEMRKEKLKNLSRTIVVIIVSFLVSMLIGAIFVLCLGKNPLEIYSALIFSPFTNIGNFGSVIRNMIPLTIIAVGVAFAGNCGLCNLGGDGQFLMGALAMIIVSTTVGKYIGSFSILVGMALGAVFGAVTGGIAGYLKYKFKVSEIITVLMLNYIVDYFIAYLDHGPMLKPGSSTPQTSSVHDYEKIPRIFKSTTFSYSIFIAIACLIVFWLIMNKTAFGYKIKVIGGSTMAARYGGIDPGKYYFRIMALSGAFAGFAGAVEVCSFAYCVQDGISNSYGFNSVMVALLGFYHPIGMLAAAFFFSVLLVGGNVMQITCKVPTTISTLLVGMTVLFVLFGLSTGDRKAHRKEKHSAPSAKSVSPAPSRQKGVS